MIRHEFLTHLHRLTEPRNYLEIGVNDGRSLALSRVRSIGVDPAFKVNVELECDLQLVKATSDDFFARDNAIARFPEGVVDLIFIDGLHLFEFALRDFINAEQLAHPGTVVVFDDMLPRTIDEAARDRHTMFWAGDVYNVALALARYRPDLVLVPVDTVPTGLLLVVGLDPTSTVLKDSYDEIVAAFRHDDPQRVPAEILSRSQAADPEKLVAADTFREISVLRSTGRVPDFTSLRSLSGSATYQPVPYDNPARPLHTAEAMANPGQAKRTATKNAAKKTAVAKAPPQRPTVVRRFKRAVRAFLA